MKKLSPQSFLKNGSSDRSVIIGAPPEFDFLASLRDAVSIKAAITFGHMSGWKRVSSTLSSSRARNIQFLIGQSLLQTEPDVLDSICELESDYFHGKLAQVQPTFHPKIWIVESRKTSYVIVGSSNLSSGGFAENIECSAYLDTKEAFESLDNWFKSRWKQATPLMLERQSYREKYAKTLEMRAAAKKAVQQAMDELASVESEWRRQEAIKQARKYFASQQGKDSGQHRIAAMEKIEKCLKPPSFTFGKDDWHNFLKIHEFGSMHRIRKDMDQYLPQLRKAFIQLADNSKQLATRVDEVVPNRGRFHVPGIGMNIVTKVLAMLDRKECAVYNERVAKTLRAFGYEIRRAKTDGELYATYCRDMRAFVRDCGLSEMLSIDSFFEDYSRIV